VVITAAVREDDRVVAVASRPIFRSAREVGAFYRSALAHELAEQGYEIAQATGKDGRYFEIVGVPTELCVEFSGRSREVARAAERFRARYGRAPERGELRDLALENRRAKTLTTRGDLERVWTETGRRHGFGPGEALQLLGGPRRTWPERPVADRIEARLTEHHAVFQAGDLRAVALEQTAGEMAPEEALGLARGMVRDRRVLTLEGGRMTTLDVRACEQAIERRAAALALPAGRDAGEAAREHAVRKVTERIGGPLSPEQHYALGIVTGPERAAVLVGPAGTGKGIVIDAAARAERHAGRQVIGVAVSGSTAERFGADSPALGGRTSTLDALVARANVSSVRVGSDTTVFVDEAGMLDHRRMDALTGLVERSGAKLIAVGDGKQLPSIGPGGMFDRLATHVPTAELADIRRTQDPEERRAWAALRVGEPERAMAHYFNRAQLHFADTRDEAGEAAVRHWMTLAERHGFREVALIADASNKEIDRLNARAQHIRAQRGELGRREVALEHTHYGLREGDIVAFVTQHRPPDQSRVENGTRGEVSRVDEHGRLTVALDGSGRHVRLAGEDIDSLRLAYAQHVYRQQGATVERSVVVSGGLADQQGDRLRRGVPRPPGHRLVHRSAPRGRTLTALCNLPGVCARPARRFPRLRTASHTRRSGWTSLAGCVAPWRVHPGSSAASSLPLATDTRIARQAEGGRTRGSAPLLDFGEQLRRRDGELTREADDQAEGRLRPAGLDTRDVGVNHLDLSSELRLAESASLASLGEIRPKALLRRHGPTLPNQYSIYSAILHSAIRKSGRQSIDHHQ
jgi:hypothetical protein